MSARLEHTLSHYHTGAEGNYHANTAESDPDRIRVQIDLTKFDQLEVSDCESLDEPPIGNYLSSSSRFNIKLLAVILLVIICRLQLNNTSTQYTWYLTHARVHLLY